MYCEFWMHDFYSEAVLILWPLPQLDCACMSSCCWPLTCTHELCVGISFAHTHCFSHPSDRLHLFSSTRAAIYSSMHLFTQAALRLSVPFNPCLVSSVLWRNGASVFSLSVFTPLSRKLNKELNQGHHLWLLCASMILSSANAWAFNGP